MVQLTHFQTMFHFNTQKCAKQPTITRIENITEKDNLRMFFFGTFQGYKEMLVDNWFYLFQLRFCQSQLVKCTFHRLAV